MFSMFIHASCLINSFQAIAIHAQCEHPTSNNSLHFDIIEHIDGRKCSLQKLNIERDVKNESAECVRKERSVPLALGHPNVN